MLVQAVHSTLLQGSHLVQRGTDSMGVDQLTTHVLKYSNSYLIQNCEQHAGLILLVATTPLHLGYNIRILYYSKYHNKTTFDMMNKCYLFIVQEFCSHSLQIWMSCCHDVQQNNLRVK
jgi:hypothetical protein